MRLGGSPRRSKVHASNIYGDKRFGSECSVAWEIRGRSVMAILEWDWRYRVGFDARLAERVKAEIDALPRGPAWHAAELQFDWARSFVSLDRLIEAVGAGELGVDDLACKSPLLHVPNELAASLLDKISSLDRIGRSGKSRFMTLLDAGRKQTYAPYHCRLFEIIFGNELPALLAQAAAVARVPKPPRVPIAPDEIPGLVSAFRAQMARLPSFQGNAEDSVLPDFHLEITHQNHGFAEYWPTALLPPEPRETDSLCTPMRERWTAMRFGRR